MSSPNVQSNSIESDETETQEPQLLQNEDDTKSEPSKSTDRLLSSGVGEGLTVSTSSQDISLSSQTTLRYCDVEGESKKDDTAAQESISSEVLCDSSKTDNTEVQCDSSSTDNTEVHEQPQFKNSFYEKLSVTCQNLENTVNLLQKPGKEESPLSKVETNEETESQINSAFSDPENNSANRPDSLLLLSSNPSNDSNIPKHDIDISSHISKLEELAIDIENKLANDKDNIDSVALSRVAVEEGAHYIEASALSPDLLQGTAVQKGAVIEFVADNLEQRIKQSSPLSQTEAAGNQDSRRSSVRSIASTSTSTSFATSSSVSRSPSSILQQSPDDIPPIDAGAVLELENHAQRVADSLDLMMGNIRSNLHKMSAITIGCQDAYKRSVDITCDSVDGSIKTMYALMAKCEELSLSMKPVNQLAVQIKEIKRILDLFEAQLSDK